MRCGLKCQNHAVSDGGRTSPLNGITNSSCNTEAEALRIVHHPKYYSRSYGMPDTLAKCVRRFAASTTRQR